MLAVIVGITSALIFGAADFLGGLASKRISSLKVTGLVAATGLIVLLLLIPILGAKWSPSVLVLGAISGVTGAIAIVLLYACLAIGPMSILSPLTAVVSAVVPLTAGLIRGERLGTVGYVAIGLALVAVVLVGFVPEKHAVRPSLRGILMAIGSGAMIGVFLIVIDLTPADSGLAPLVMNRAVNSAIMFTVIGILALVAAWSRRRARLMDAPIAVTGSGWLPGLRLSIAAGIVDAVANAGLLYGLRIGELSIQSVLTALYPAGTIILAAIVLKERIAVVQYVGLALAIGAGALLALA
jgi:drug/metabolite transporter (DMT)-like permease